MFNVGKAWRQRRKLLVLGPGGQRFVDLGVINDLAEQFLAQRGERALPEFAGGFTLLDEHPILRGDCAGVHEHRLDPGDGRQTVRSRPQRLHAGHQDARTAHRLARESQGAHRFPGPRDGEMITSCRVRADNRP